MKFIKLLSLAILISQCGCEKQERSEIKVSEHGADLENLMIHSDNQENVSGLGSVSNVISIDTTDIRYSVKLIRETVFESNEEVFMDGYIGEIAVDNDDRVYITATNPGSIGIYIFEPDGSFITSFGQEGRGPGEFESIGSISIQGNKLYVFGPRLQKFGVFSLDDYQLIRDQIIRRDSIPKHDELARILRVNELQVTESGEILAKMSNLSLREENEITKVLYHKISADGHILPERILELDKYRFYFPSNAGYPILMPFVRNTLVATSGDGTFYTAWSEDFLIKVYDADGNYKKAFYHPVSRARLSMDEILLNKDQQRILSNYKLPDTWQALHTIETDDKNRLWVSTITESDSTFKWWVLNDKGELLATFTKPGARTENSVMTKPLYKIQNGYFFERERDIRNGIDRIVKYKIEFKER
ncbi:MAG: 6-bladed beta-propeller [Balneolaceae bacterium]